MRDDFLGRDWADHHHHVSDSIRALIDTVARSLAKMHAWQFDAPWRVRPECDRAGCD